MFRGRRVFLVFLFLLLPLNLQAQDQDFLVWKKLAFFVISWVENINNNFQYSPQQPQIVQVNNLYVASFSKINPESISFHLKKTPNSYLGILEYDEVIYQAQALTLESLRQTPFVPVKVRRLTEIFRYNGSSWE